MSYILVSQQSEFQELLRRLRDVPVIAYDTEFISEGRYQPQLCLVQIAAGDVLALIDPLAVQDLEPLWELFCDGRREILVHACRSEMEFCHRSIGRMPEKPFDVQLAAGMVGLDYPSGFRTLLDRLLDIDLPKAESRTVWNNRPLSSRQIEYALGDVRYLEKMSAVLKDRLQKTGRSAWYGEEINRLTQRLKHDFETPRWRNLPKIASFKPRELAIAREVWFWRDRLARKWNQPAGRVLRDDLVVELAKRGTSDAKRIASVRGFQRSDLSRILPEISSAIQRALDMSEEELPDVLRHSSYPQYQVLTQFLYAALGALCKRRKIAQQLVGGPGDVRELIAGILGTLPRGNVPRLASGWRQELIGTELEDILQGRTVIRLDPKQPDDPLVFGQTSNGNGPF